MLFVKLRHIEQYLECYFSQIIRLYITELNTLSMQMRAVENGTIC